MQIKKITMQLTNASFIISYHFIYHGKKGGKYSDVWSRNNKSMKNKEKNYKEKKTITTVKTTEQLPKMYMKSLL